MINIRLAGVPEHFNYPWKYALKNNYFQNEKINLIWKDFPGGTGAMASALKNNETDLALLLTEGAVKEIAAGASFKIMTPYVDSPLLWGIHSGKQDTIVNNLSDKKYAISRFGSGSHLMACVHASQHGNTLRDDQFVIVGDIQGARKALKEGTADLFFWERFMTKPLVDAGEFFLVETMPTPWPCFMLVADESFYQKNKEAVDLLLSVVRKTIKELLEKENLNQLIADEFHLQATDVKEWLSITKWSADNKLETQKLEKVRDSLLSLNMIDKSGDVADYVYLKSDLI